MRERGTHTFDLYLDYQRCPHCGLILENRQPVKKIICTRCGKDFSARKKITEKGFFFKGAQNFEIMWE